MDANADDLKQFKVKQLKEFLRSRGEQVSGSKRELLDRAQGVLILNKQPLADITLNDQNRDNQRLSDKLVTPLGERLPDPVNVTSWDSNVTSIPAVSDKDLYNFLVLNTNRTHDFRKSGAKKQLKAKVFYEDRHVHSILYTDITDSCSHCFVKCFVLPSIPNDTNAKKPDYNVWVCLSKVTGHIHSASCSCPAG